MRDAVRSFAMNVVLPVANELDPQHGLIPQHLVSTMAEMGLFGILVPEQYGGLGLGLVEYCMVTEELARAWMSVASIIARGNGLIAGFSAAQREAILPRVARGEYLGAFALSEPDAGSDIASIRTRAERDGDEWVITGQKMWCTYADQADYLIVVARTTPYDPPTGMPASGASTSRRSAARFPPGVVGTPIRKIGYFGWQTWELSIDGLRVPADNLLDARGRSDRTTRRDFARCRGR